MPGSRRKRSNLSHNEKRRGEGGGGSNGSSSEEVQTRVGQRGREAEPGLFLYNNTGAEGQADRTVISLQGAKAKTLLMSLGLEELARGPVQWAGAMISEARNLRQAGPMD